jgi:two-component sensor histidine kinase
MTIKEAYLAPLARWGIPDWIISILVGSLLGALAVGIRLALGLPAEVLPFGIVYPLMLISAMIAGTISGISTFVVGGFLAWYFVLDGGSGSHDTRIVPAFALIGITVLWAAELYRRSERKLHQTKLEFAQNQAQHQQLLSRELNHRVKNMLGLVQAVAYQTFGKIEGNAIHDFNGRLKAISDAQSILTKDANPTADLRDIIAAAMKPFQTGNVTTVGPTCTIDDQQATWLSLTLHELATNSTKYGALSLPYGHVTIDTKQITDGDMGLIWQEHDGPKVVQPIQQGFGTKLLQQGKAKVEYLPGGVKCEIRRIRCVAGTHRNQTS